MNPSINPGAGYRLVEVGEEVIAGDEYYSQNGDWFMTTWAGRKASPNSATYRRRVEPMPIRPPLGLRPREIWVVETLAVAHATRRQEILDAMNRYIHSGRAIPAEWVAEYLELAAP